MLQYAGNTSKRSFKYFIFIDIVKKLKQWSQSAGKTSETIRNNAEHIKKISIHVPTHLKPLNDEQWGHYLAGLIDGDGDLSKGLSLKIAFHSLDVGLAYYIKSRIGFGNVRKEKENADSEKAYTYTVGKKEGMLKILHLINNKLRTVKKYNQGLNILKTSRYSSEKIEWGMNTTKDFKNHWIAGFSDGGATFQIKTLKRPGRSKRECEERIRLNYQVDQKGREELNLIKEEFGGNIGNRVSQECGQRTYYYGSTSFGSAKKVISYFDTYHLQSSKYINYLKWRKVYIMVQTKDHLTEKGIEKIKKIKKSMSRGSV